MSNCFYFSPSTTTFTYSPSSIPTIFSYHLLPSPPSLTPSLLNYHPSLVQFLICYLLQTLGHLIKFGTVFLENQTHQSFMFCYQNDWNIQPLPITPTPNLYATILYPNHPLLPPSPLTLPSNICYSHYLQMSPFHPCWIWIEVTAADSSCKPESYFCFSIYKYSKTRIIQSPLYANPRFSEPSIHSLIKVWGPSVLDSKYSTVLNLCTTYLMYNYLRSRPVRIIIALLHIHSLFYSCLSFYLALSGWRTSSISLSPRRNSRCNRGSPGYDGLLKPADSYG